MPVKIDIEICFAEPLKQQIEILSVHIGATVEEAIQQSSLKNCFQEIPDWTNRIGIFGKSVGLDAVVKSGDRIELYRPLMHDPKETRRMKALQTPRK